MADPCGMSPWKAVHALTVLLAGLAVVQAALALGAPLGKAAWGGQHEVLPAGLRIGSVVAIVIYAVIVWVMRRHVADTGSRPFRIAAWTIAAYFLVGVALNVASASPWERFLMAPLAAVLSGLSFFVARGKDGRR